MRLNPFGGRGGRRQTPAEVRTERDQLAADLAALAERLTAARQLIDTLTEDCGWFHDHWVEVGERAIQAETVAACLEDQLAEANRKVIAMERIAGTYVDSSTAPEPLYAAVAERRDGEVTREFRALTAGPEPIGAVTLVKPLATALGGAA